MVLIHTSVTLEEKKKILGYDTTSRGKKHLNAGIRALLKIAESKKININVPIEIEQ